MKSAVDEVHGGKIIDSGKPQRIQTLTILAVEKDAAGDVRDPLKAGVCNAINECCQTGDAHGASPKNTGNEVWVTISD
jgi:hypothetical protein